MDKKTQLNMLYVGIAVFVILLLQNWSTRRGVEVIPYSEFEQLLQNDRAIQFSSTTPTRARAFAG